MKKNTITLPMLVFIAVLCVSIVAFPTTASGAEGEPDAVAGDVVALRSTADTFSVVPSSGYGETSTRYAVAGRCLLTALVAYMLRRRFRRR